MDDVAGMTEDSDFLDREPSKHEKVEVSSPNASHDESPSMARFLAFFDRFESDSRAETGRDRLSQPHIVLEPRFLSVRRNLDGESSIA